MRVFIACNSYLETGGVELVHQLITELNKRNVDAYIVYPQKTFSEKDPTPEVYKKYGARIASEYLDTEDSVYIIPEVYLEQLAWVQKGQAVVWWMSVDNRASSKMNQLEGKNVIHLVQSYYAKDFVEKTFGDANCYFLSDYISDVIREYGEENRERFERKNICFYNPQKGLEHIEQLINRTEGRFQWMPLVGLTPEEVAKRLCSGKVYIDMGNHPGKDRIPREAAYCGCCVLTNRRGSAAFSEDIGIPEKYKISDEKDYDAIINQIEQIMKNYDSTKVDFFPYIDQIEKEKEVFLDEIDCVVEVLKTVAQKKETQEVERDIVAKYLSMMNQQLEYIKCVNGEIGKVVASENFREKCINILIEEDRLYQEMMTEVWELMRYFAE